MAAPHNRPAPLRARPTARRLPGRGGWIALAPSEVRVPIYEYQCPDCGHRFDALQKFSDDPIRTCPKCTAENVRKLISAPALHFKGSGWAHDNYGLKSSAKGAEGGSSGEGASSDSSSSSTSTAPAAPAAAGSAGSSGSSGSSSSGSTAGAS